jgi:hypothetical protein
VRVRVRVRERKNLKHRTVLWNIASQNYIETSLQHYKKTWHVSLGAGNP